MRSHTVEKEVRYLLNSVLDGLTYSRSRFDRANLNGVRRALRNASQEMWEDRERCHDDSTDEEASWGNSRKFMIEDMLARVEYAKSLLDDPSRDKFVLELLDAAKRWLDKELERKIEED